MSSTSNETISNPSEDDAAAVAVILLTLPQDVFRRVMNSACAYNREVMHEFGYRLEKSFEIVPDAP